MHTNGKVNISLSNASRLLHPMHTVLVTCVGKNGKANIITIAWAMPTSINPPLVAISVRPNRHSYRLLVESGDFVVNIPTMEIVRETLFCGRRSGRTHDKFDEMRLTPLPAKAVKAPLIKQCVAHLECRLSQAFTTGDHVVFIGEVVAASADEGSFSDVFDIKRVKLLYHLGGDKFATLLEEIEAPEL
jgi:flavin reductase (DIM6/NTAB) family NADH-FMN oxidoreductase RutF